MASTTERQRAEDLKRDAGPPDLSKHTDVIDPTTFDQILEMDDDESRDFSRGIVLGFFEQAETTFEKMELALKEENLDELSRLGHFLKGSSATLGLTKVKDACEKIQHYGAGKDGTGSSSEPKDKCFENIKLTLKDVKKDYAEVVTILKRFFGENVDEGKGAETGTQSS